MSILFNINYQRAYYFRHRGRESTFDLYNGKGVLIFSSLDTNEEFILAEHLDSMNIPTATIPMPLAPENIRMSLGEKQQLITYDKEVPFHRISSVWFLCNMDRPMPADANQVEHEFDLSEWRTTIWTLREELRAIWVNDPFRSCISRLGAIGYARNLGLNTPRTLITNDPKVAKSFHDRMGPCVVKRVGHVFPSLPNGDIFGIFTRRLTDADFDGDRFTLCPVLVQEEIPKKYEYRVYIIGNDVLPFRLYVGDVLDWREIGAFKVDKEYVNIASDIAHTLRTMVKSFGLLYAAIDLIEDLKGNLHFIEINPNGTYEFCDNIIKPTITERICSILVSDFR